MVIPISVGETESKRDTSTHILICERQFRCWTQLIFVLVQGPPLPLSSASSELFLSWC